MGRRDGAGHLPAGVASFLRARTRDEGGSPADDERAFFCVAHSDDPLAEQLGESFVIAVTGGEEASVDAADEA